MTGLKAPKLGLSSINLDSNLEMARKRSVQTGSFIYSQILNGKWHVDQEYESSSSGSTPQ